MKIQFRFCYEFYDSKFQMNAKKESNQTFPVEWTRNRNTIIHGLNVVNGRNAMNILIFRSIIIQNNNICADWRIKDWSRFQLFLFSVYRKMRESSDSLVNCFQLVSLVKMINIWAWNVISILIGWFPEINYINPSNDIQYVFNPKIMKYLLNWTYLWIMLSNMHHSTVTIS